MNSTHTYTATLLTDPEVPLSIRGGSITLDESAAPHVQASLDLALPAQDVLDALDPRENVRVRIDAAAEFPSSAQSRSFDLGVRSRPVRHAADGYASLSLASDEALLSDYAPLADDETPYSLASSLRAVVNYALDTAIPGAALEAAPAVDTDVTPYADSDNLFTNPACTTTTGYAARRATLSSETVFLPNGRKGIYLGTPTDQDCAITTDGDAGAMRLGMTAGKTYVVAATGSVRSTIGGEGDRARRICVFYVTPSGTTELKSEPVSATPETGNSAGTRVSVTFTIPDDATQAFIRFYHGGTSGGIAWSNFRLSEYTGDPADLDYFDGDSTATDGYAYAWSGTANASTTTRTALIDRSVDSLLWEAGTDALSFLAPIVQAAGYRLVCDESRAWTLRSDGYRADGGLTVRHGVNLIEGEDVIDRDTGLWFDAQITRYTWTDRDGIQQTKIDAYALNDPPTRVNLVELAVPFLGVGRSEYAVNRAQGRGREVTVTTVADWRTHAEQACSFVLENAPIQTGATSKVTFDLSTDRMTVTSRTTDTPAMAWVLIPTDETWTDQPAGESWTDEEAA